MKPMKSILSRALLVGLGLSVTAVQAQAQSCGSGTDPFPATGQTSSYPAFTVDGNIAVQDDGAVRAGSALSYTGTGPTIIDNNTGLEWEVLGQPDVTLLGFGGIHDYRTLYYWSCPDVAGLSQCGVLPYMSIWDKVLLMNNEGGGYAGHHDWRVPNVKELQSIIDYGSFGPAVDSIFNNGSHTGVCNPNSTGCSFTDSINDILSPNQEPRYWTSTTQAPGNNNTAGENAWYVSFGGGAVRADDGQKNSHKYHVRLVRGGCSNGTPLSTDY